MSGTGQELCNVCGLEIDEGYFYPYPPNGDVVHMECLERYWDAPGEAGLTEESW